MVDDDAEGTLATDNRIFIMHFEPYFRYPSGETMYFEGTQLNLWNYEIKIPDADVSNVTLVIEFGVELQENDNYHVISDSISYNFYNGNFSGGSN